MVEMGVPVSVHGDEAGLEELKHSHAVCQWDGARDVSAMVWSHITSKHNGDCRGIALFALSLGVPSTCYNQGRALPTPSLFGFGPCWQDQPQPGCLTGPPGSASRASLSKQLLGALPFPAAPS